ncbi:hypothetical protein [Nocardioides dokdonensis]|uniref:hypothetical protein n=1 Tax=Nocardioides dokdonensis TaxID=450734 RepID=UPI00083112F6|nr:hypothetical protein [Nocardioides dokdonensis]
MSNRINDSMGESRTTLLRVGVLVAIAVLVATAVWLGARGRTDDSSGTDKTSGDSSSQPGSRGRTSRSTRSPESAPADGVVIPTGADQVDGYPTRFPQTDLGAVALQVEVAKAQVGFDYDQAAAVAGLYANPEDTAVFEQRARDAVALRRQQAGVPKEGDVPPPASYAVTPIAYTLEELDTGYYAVNLLSYVTLTTANGKVSDGLYAGTQLMRWLEVDGVGDWCLVQAAPQTSSTWSPQPKAVAPGTPEYKQAGWIPINGTPVSTADLFHRVTRLGIDALAVLVLTTLLGAATTIQPPTAAAAEPATSTAASTAQVATVETTSQLPARTLKMGCLGPTNCATSAETPSSARRTRSTAARTRPVASRTRSRTRSRASRSAWKPQPHRLRQGSRGSVPGVSGCGLLDAICAPGSRGSDSLASRGCPASPDSRTWGTSSAPASPASVTSPTRSRTSGRHRQGGGRCLDRSHARGVELRPVRAAHRAHVQRAVLDPRPQRRRTR